MTTTKVYFIKHFYTYFLYEQIMSDRCYSALIYYAERTSLLQQAVK